MTDRYAVVGHPVAHSKSPAIHRLFAEQTGQDMVYETLLAPLDGFAETTRKFFAEGGKGLNVTVPFKAEAFVLADTCSSRAVQAGAVNTLGMDADGRLWGDNTDGVGLVRDLRGALGLTLSEHRLLVLGAGGAACGILGPLLEEGPRELVVANRTATKAEALAARFRCLGPVRGCGLADLFGIGAFDLILNATSASLSEALPVLPLGLVSTDTVCYDLAYGSEPTAFMRWGQAQGAARTEDGLGMLIEQAAVAFERWRGVHPDTTRVREILRPDSPRAST
ncbi:MAG: shikimate dehydrogenase [Pseudomonadota bacterium]